MKLKKLDEIEKRIADVKLHSTGFRSVKVSLQMEVVEKMAATIRRQHEAMRIAREEFNREFCDSELRCSMEETQKEWGEE